MVSLLVLVAMVAAAYSLSNSRRDIQGCQTAKGTV
jgi:hypothetical protein